MLPKDIEEEIIGHLWDDKDTLVDCALTRRSFLFPSQKLLFHKIYLTPHSFCEGQKTIASLEEILILNPRLRRYVRHLEITDEKSQWLLDDPSISNVLLLLNNLEGLVIKHSKHTCEAPVPWTDSLLSALLSLLHSPNLKFLSLRNCPIEWAVHGQHLTYLSVHATCIQPIPSRLCMTCDEALSVDALEIWASYYDVEKEVYLWMRNAINTEKITKLFASAGGYRHVHVAFILQDCATTLTELALVTHCPTVDRKRNPLQEDTIDWRSLCSLRLLYIQFQIPVQDDYEMRHEVFLVRRLCWLYQMLLEFSSTNHCLQEFTIRSVFDIWVSPNDLSVDALDPREWYQVIGVLLDKTRFPLLQKVNLQVVCSSDDHTETLMVVYKKYASLLRDGSNPKLNVALTAVDKDAPLFSFP